MVKKPKLAVVWDKQAYSALQKLYDYIREESIVNAEKVRSEILRMTATLAEHPEKYPPDKFKKSNTGNYRAFEKFSYRIAYKVTDDRIIILRVRHVKQEPRNY